MFACNVAREYLLTGLTAAHLVSNTKRPSRHVDNVVFVRHTLHVMAKIELLSLYGVRTSEKRHHKKKTILQSENS